MDSVYGAGMGKSRQIPDIEPEDVFFSPSGLGEGIPRRAFPSLPTQLVINEAGCLKVAQFSVVLTIFTAEVDVKLDEKLSTELYRAMRKNPPRKVKCQLVYVCSLTTPITGDANVPFRRGRKSMTQARKKMTFSPK